MITLIGCIKRTCAILSLALISQSALANSDAIATLADYFKLLSTGNFESAGNMWTEAAIERSSRFGIEYKGIPLKVDCNSPIVRDLERMSDYLEPPVKQVTELPGGNYVKLEYSAVVEGKLMRHFYYTFFDGDYYWLTYPQDYYCRDWPVRESEYFRIHAHPDVQQYLNPVILEEADKFVETTAASLGITKADLQAIKEHKIEYFYCDSDATVKEIVGVLTKGTVDLPSNDIITSFFPHDHEVTHLLVNYKLRHLQPYTHPLLREGLAVYYGGRWGKAPEALMDLACFLYRGKIVDIDSLLTVARFTKQASSDIAYPVAGLFTAYLIDKIGLSGYEGLYRGLSGSMEEIQSLAPAEVVNKLLKAAQKPSWEALLSDFNEFVNRQETENAVIMPGEIEQGTPLINGNGFAVTNNSDWLTFEFTGKTSEPPAGNLLFGHDERLGKVNSVMFHEQYFGERTFEGYRYGVRFDRNEAGLYDYATNQLLAKYIWGIAPSDDYFDEQQNKITIRLKKSLVGDKLPEENNYKLIPL